MKRELRTVETGLTDCATGLNDGDVDVALLYDTFHDLEKPAAVLRELHRVLKPGGILSFSDHHMKEPDILAGIAAGGLFALLRRGEKTYTFAKQG
ncbi:class I SAM-dependent methyltransferase [bacterium]|nr:class I SAM-dependent methyltransferase [bacterium]